MPKVYDRSESVEELAQQLIPTFHPELATARMIYTCVDKGSSKNGRPLLGKVRRVSGVLEFLLEADFLFEVAVDHWNELSGDQRLALVDHLLERCTGEENEENGTMEWKTREPDVQEFSTILRRRGTWTPDLENFVSVAKTLDLDNILEEVEENVSISSMDN